MEYRQVTSHFAELSASLLSVDREELRKAVKMLARARGEKRSVYIVGNGGSAATASHFANDLAKMCGIKAFSIPDMTALTLAFANDHGFEHIFEHTVDVFFEPGDVLVAISCSGRSVNVTRAAHLIENVIALTGNSFQSPLVDLQPAVILNAMSDDITIQEDIHLAICHAIAKALVT